MENWHKFKILIMTFTFLLTSLTSVLGASIPELLGVRPIESFQLQENETLTNPQFCPTNTDWVAFEKTSGNNILTYICRSDLYTEDPNYLTTVAVRAGINENSQFFSWCPITYQEQKYYCFAADDGQGDLDIYISKVSSRDLPIKLTNLDGNETYPVWNSEGNKIAFLAEGNNALYLITGIERLLNLNDTLALQTKLILKDELPKADLAFSPSGSFIAFATTGEQKTVSIISTLNPEEAFIAVESTEKDFKGPAWRSDGKMLAFYQITPDEINIGILKIKKIKQNLSIDKNIITVGENLKYIPNSHPCWIPWFKTLIAISRTDAENDNLVLINLMESGNFIEGREFQIPLTSYNHFGYSAIKIQDKHHVTFLDWDDDWNIQVGQLLTNSLSELEIKTITESKWKIASKSLMFWAPGSSYEENANFLQMEYARTGETKYLDKSAGVIQKGKIIKYASFAGYGIGASLIVPWFMKKTEFDSKWDELGLTDGDTTSDYQLRDLYEETDNLKSLAYAGGAVILGSYLANVVISYLDAPKTEYPDMVDIGSQSKFKVLPVINLSNNFKFGVTLRY
jgi:hypothetical protein